MRDINASNIKNWRRETQDRDKWRKTINHGVTYNIVHTDATRIVREYKERAANRRAQEELSHQIKQNTLYDSNPLDSTTDDVTCTQCGRSVKTTEA
jgi:hypothetical protein